MTQTLWSTPTAEQLLLLKGMHASLVAQNSWPDVRYLGRWLRKSSGRADVRQVLESFPVVGDSRRGVGPSYSAVWYDPNNHGYDAKVRLTLAAGLQLAEYTHFTDTYVELIRLCARRVAIANPFNGPVVVRSQGLYKKFGVDRAFEIGSFPWVLQYEPLGLSGRLETFGDGWKLTLNEVLAEYANIESLEDYVHKAVELVEQECAKSASQLSRRDSARGTSASPPSAHRQELVTMDEEKPYDIAVSFAGEDRAYVAAVVAACKERHLNVFYDEDMSNEWWGRSVIREQRRVYGSQTRFFVPFISASYLNKPFPKDEFEAAMMTAVKRGDDYVLPVLIGDVDVPAELLPAQIRYLRAEDHTPEQLADQLVRRVGRARSAGQQPKDVAEVVHAAYDLRMPKRVPDTFSTYQELQRAYDYLADRFREATSRLGPHGFVGTVNKSDTVLSIRIERRGETVYALDVNKGGSFGDNRLEFSYDRTGGGINGWAIPVFDKDAREARLDMVDLSMAGGTGSTKGRVSNQELFDRLWDRTVERLEQA